MDLGEVVRPLLQESETIEQVIPVRHERPFEPRGVMSVFKDVGPTGALVITPNRIVVLALFNVGTRRNPTYEAELEARFPRTRAIRFEPQSAVQRFNAWMNSYHGKWVTIDDVLRRWVDDAASELLSPYATR